MLGKKVRSEKYTRLSGHVLSEQQQLFHSQMLNDKFTLSVLRYCVISILFRIHLMRTLLWSVLNGIWTFHTNTYHINRWYHLVISRCSFYDRIEKINDTNTELILGDAWYNVSVICVSTGFIFHIGLGAHNVLSGKIMELRIDILIFNFRPTSQSMSGRGMLCECLYFLCSLNHNTSYYRSIFFGLIIMNYAIDNA